MKKSWTVEEALENSLSTCVWYTKKLKSRASDAEEEFQGELSREAMSYALATETLLNVLEGSSDHHEKDHSELIAEAQKVIAIRL